MTGEPGAQAGAWGVRTRWAELEVSATTTAMTLGAAEVCSSP